MFLNRRSQVKFVNRRCVTSINNCDRGTALKRLDNLKLEYVYMSRYVDIIKNIKEIDYCPNTIRQIMFKSICTDFFSDVLINEILTSDMSQLVLIKLDASYIDNKAYIKIQEILECYEHVNFSNYTDREYIILAVLSMITDINNGTFIYEDMNEYPSLFMIESMNIYMNGHAFKYMAKKILNDTYRNHTSKNGDVFNYINVSKVNNVSSNQKDGIVTIQYESPCIIS